VMVYITTSVVACLSMGNLLYLEFIQTIGELP